MFFFTSRYREINMIHIKCIHSRLTFIRGYIIIYKPPKQVRCMLYLSVHTCRLLLMVVDCKGNLDGCVYDGTRAYKIIIKAYSNYIQPTTALYYYIRDSPDRHAYLHHPPLRFAQFLSLLIVAPQVKIIIYTCVKLPVHRRRRGHAENNDNNSSCDITHY